MERSARVRGNAPGRLLKRWRESNGFDVTQAAKALGVTRHTYRKWEVGTKPPGLDAWFTIHRLTEGAVPWHAWASTAYAASLFAMVSTAAPPTHNTTDATTAMAPKTKAA